MIEIRFHFSEERLDTVTIGDLEDMEDGQIKVIRGVMGRFLVDGAGEYVDEAEARRVLRALNRKQFSEAQKQFMEALRGRAVNPTTASG